MELTGELMMKELAPHLERRAWGLGGWMRDTCAFHAKIALARMGHGRAIAEIERDLESPKRDTVSSAVVAAGRARLSSLLPRIEALGADAVDADLRRAAVERLVRRRPSSD